MVKRVLKESGNTFKTAASFVKQPSVFFFYITRYFIFRKIQCLALRLKCHNNTREAQTGAKCIPNTDLSGHRGLFCTDLLDVLFDMSGDEWVVDDRQHHGRVLAGDPAADQQAAVRPVTALREEDLQHHDFTAAQCSASSRSDDLPKRGKNNQVRLLAQLQHRMGGAAGAILDFCFCPQKP